MVQVNINDGTLEGEEVQNEYGRSYFSFKGIPYAQPPVGDLRFKAPQPVQPWTGIRTATEFGPICYQYSEWETDVKGEFGDGKMSEDCLYLNVYSPDIKPTTLLPVMVYVQGGAFICDSGNDHFYGPQFLVRHGVILVTFNYRLEALGFLCLQTADIPGNAGMKDQVAAFRWVKKNIKNFGGDPDNITIFGQSAGAGCIGIHLVSPMTKGLFKRAIAQSGALACWWLEDLESREKALLLAKQLGCFSEDNKTLYDFFKKQPVTKLVNLKLKILKAQKPYEMSFAVTDEHDFGQERFFYGNITDALRKGIHEGVDLITGFTKDENVALGFGTIKDYVNEAKYFNEFFVPQWIRTHCVVADQFDVARKMREFYFKNGEVTDEGLRRFLSTEFITYGVITTAKFLKNTKVYFYKLTCITERSNYGRSFMLDTIEDKTAVCHDDDLMYIFPVKIVFDKVDKNSEAFKMINKVTKLWTNFAKYGNPTPDESLGIVWKPYTAERQEYLILGNTFTMDTVPGLYVSSWTESCSDEKINGSIFDHKSTLCRTLVDIVSKTMQITDDCQQSFPTNILPLPNYNENTMRISFLDSMKASLLVK